MVAISTTVGPSPAPVGRSSRCQAVIGRPRDGLAEHPCSSTLPALGAAAAVRRRGGGYAERHRHERGSRAAASDRAPDAAGSDRGGQVGAGEDDHADQHADVREDGETRPLGPAVLHRLGGVLARGSGSQRTRISSPAIVTIQNSPRPMMPTVEVPTGESSGAIRNVVQTTSASTPATVCTSSSRLPTWNRPAPCPPPHPQPGEHHDHRREGGEHVDDHGQRHGRSVPYVGGSSPRPRDPRACRQRRLDPRRRIAAAPRRRLGGSSCRASRSSSASTSDIR